MHDSDSYGSGSGFQQGSRDFIRANLALFAAGFATFSLLYCVQPLMPLFSHDFDIGAAVSSLSLSISTGVLAFSILITGLMSEAINRKRMMGGCLAGAAVLSLLASLAPTWGLLLAARALSGVVLGGVPALALAYLAEETSPKALGFATGLYIGGNAIGGMAGRVIGGFMGDLGGWRLALAVMGAIGIAAALIFFWLLPRSRFFRPRHHMTLTEHIAPIRDHLRHGALPWVFLSAFALMGGFVTVYNYITYRLSEPPFDLGPSAIGAIFIVYLLGTAASTIAGRLADRYGRPQIIATGLLIMLAGLAVTWGTALLTIIVGIALVTIGFFTAHSTASGWTGQLADHGRGQAAGLYLLAYYLGSSIIGSIGGVFWTHFGWPGVSALVVLLLILAFVSATKLWLWQRT